MARIEIGLGVHWRQQSWAEIARLIDDGERAGYDCLWIANDKFYHDMYVTAAMAAARTTRTRIATFIADPYSVHPALTAMAIATLDEISGGRAVLGMGAGGTGFPEMGIRRMRAATAIREAIQIIRPLLKGETVDQQGELIAFRKGRLGFAARGDIPIVVASRSDHVYRTAGRVADGAMIATFAEPTGIAHAKAMITEGLVKAGRSMADFKLMSRVDTCIHPDRQIAYQAVKPNIAVCLWASYPDRRFVERLGLRVPQQLEDLIAARDYGLIDECGSLVPDEFVEPFAWAGTVEDVTSQVRRVVRDAGITSLTIMPIPCGDYNESDVAVQFAELVRTGVEQSL